MGKGVDTPSKAEASVIGTHLNEMFDATGFAQTKATIVALQKIYPDLLKFDANATGNRRRKSGLRFAGWLLTSDIDFSRGMPGSEYPARKFVKWLRWLTWIDRHPPPNTMVEQYDQAGHAIALAEKPAQAIMGTMLAALQSPVAGVNIMFEWEEASTTAPQLKVAVKRVAPNFVISVRSRPERLLEGDFKDNDDDNLP